MVFSKFIVSYKYLDKSFEKKQILWALNHLKKTGSKYKINISLNKKIKDSKSINIFLSNSENILKVLENFSNNLQEMKNAIKEKDGSKLVKIFTSTKEIRKEIVKAGQDTKKPDFGRKKD